MRASWKGYLAIGQVGIPVRLFAATTTIRPHFVQLHDADGAPVRRSLRCTHDGKELSANEIIHAVEYEPGQYVTFTDEELENAGTPHLKAIDIRQFCDADAIDPIYYEKPYFIVPSAGGERGYALIREALVQTHKMAITQVVIYNKDHVAAIGAHGDLLVLYQLRFAGEIVPRSNLRTRPLSRPSPREMDIMCELIERFSGPFYIHDYHDEHGEYLQLLVGHKAKGLPMPKPEKPPREATPENQIEAALDDILHHSRHLGTGEMPNEDE